MGDIVKQAQTELIKFPVIGSAAIGYFTSLYYPELIGLTDRQFYVGSFRYRAPINIMIPLLCGLGTYWLTKNSRTAVWATGACGAAEFVANIQNPTPALPSVENTEP